MVDMNERVQLKALEDLFVQKRFPEALTLAEKLNAEFPNSFHINILYVKVLKEMNRIGEAEQIAARLLQLYPNNINLLLELGYIYLVSNKYDYALEYYNKALFMDPFNTEAKESIDKINVIKQTVVENGNKERSFISYQNGGQEKSGDTEPELGAARMIQTAVPSAEMEVLPETPPPQPPQTNSLSQVQQLNSQVKSQDVQETEMLSLSFPDDSSENEAVSVQKEDTNGFNPESDTIPELLVGDMQQEEIPDLFEADVPTSSAVQSEMMGEENAPVPPVINFESKEQDDFLDIAPQSRISTDESTIKEEESDDIVPPPSFDFKDPEIKDGINEITPPSQMEFEDPESKHEAVNHSPLPGLDFEESEIDEEPNEIAPPPQVGFEEPEMTAKVSDITPPPRLDIDELEMEEKVREGASQSYTGFEEPEIEEEVGSNVLQQNLDFDKHEVDEEFADTPSSPVGSDEMVVTKDTSRVNHKSDFDSQKPEIEKETTNKVTSAIVVNRELEFKEFTEPEILDSADDPAIVNEGGHADSDESEFVTQSAAELYFSQGLYEDALNIYEKLYSAQKEETYRLKIEQLKNYLINRKKIQVLTAFLDSIKKKGEKIV